MAFAAGRSGDGQERDTILLQYLRHAAADLDTAWIGAWEDTYDEAKPIEHATDPDPALRTTLFLAGLDLQEQAPPSSARPNNF